MSLDKSILKALIAEGFASDFVGTREKAHKSIHLHRGASEAFRRVEVILNEASKTVNKTFVDGTELPFDKEDDLSIGKYVVAQLMGCARKVHELAENATLSSIRAEGELLALERAIDMLASTAQRERDRVDAAKRIAEESIAQSTAQTDGDSAQSTAQSDDETSPRRRGAGRPMRLQRMIDDIVEQSQQSEQTSEPSDKNESSAGSSKPERKRKGKARSKAKDAENTG